MSDKDMGFRLATNNAQIIEELHHVIIEQNQKIEALESVLKGHVQAVSSSCYIYEPDGNTEKEKICYLETIKDKLLEKLSAKEVEKQ